MLPTKVEIKLKKAEAISWGRLEYTKSKFFNNTNNQFMNLDINAKHHNSEAFVESVDLEDL